MKNLTVGQRRSGSLLALAVVLILFAIAIGRRLGELDLWTSLVGVAVYVIGACWWSFASAAAPSGRLPRLLFIWAPAVAPVVWLVDAVSSMSEHDYDGLAVIFLMPPTGVICLACLVASFLILLPSDPAVDEPH